MVEADSLEFPCFTVKLEAIFLCKRNTPHSEPRKILVDHFPCPFQSRAKGIKARRFGCPQRGIGYFKLRIQFSGGKSGICRRNFLSVARENGDFRIKIPVAATAQSHFGVHGSHVFGNFRRCNPNSPGVYSIFPRKNQFYRAINSTTGIPTAAKSRIV